MFQFKELICPVCGKTKFKKPKGRHAEDDLELYEYGRTFCYHCGWIYDLEQAENPKLKQGYNKLSVEEMREDYRAKIAEKPDYYWFDDFVPTPVPHPCPVCGEYQFENKKSFDICPVCGWEDDGMEVLPDFPAAGGLTYHEEVENFKRKRAENPDYRWEDCLKNRDE